MCQKLLIPRRMGGFSPLSYGSDLALWLDPSYGIYTDRSTQLTAASSQYWSVASNATLQTGDVDWWWGFWFKNSTVSGNHQVVAKDGATREYNIIIQASNLVAYLLAGAPTQCINPTVLSTSTWYFGFVYHDSVNQTLNVSVNGGAFTSVARAATPAASSIAMEIGGNSTYGFYDDGQLDSLMFGKNPVGGIAALATTIRDYLYNSGSGRVSADVTSAQKTAWGGVSAYDYDGDGLDAWGSNDLTAVNSPTYTSGIASGVAGDGDLVSLIVPRAGPNLVPPSYAGRPTWYANGGRPYISFDGVNDGLQTASNISLGAFTIAGNFYASGTAGMLVEHSDNAASSPGTYIYGSDNATIATRRGTDDSQKALSVDWAITSSWRTLARTYDGTHAGDVLRINGVAQSLTTYSSQSDNPGTGTVADKLNLGCRNQASAFSTMRLGDIVAINANLSAAQLAQLEPWLIARRSA